MTQFGPKKDATKGRKFPSVKKREISFAQYPIIIHQHPHAMERELRLDLAMASKHLKVCLGLFECKLVNTFCPRSQEKTWNFWFNYLAI